MVVPRRVSFPLPLREGIDSEMALPNGDADPSAQTVRRGFAQQESPGAQIQMPPLAHLPSSACDGILIAYQGTRLSRCGGRQA